MLVGVCSCDLSCKCNICCSKHSKCVWALVYGFCNHLDDDTQDSFATNGIGAHMQVARHHSMFAWASSNAAQLVIFRMCSYVLYKTGMPAIRQLTDLGRQAGKPACMCRPSLAYKLCAQACTSKRTDGQADHRADSLSSHHAYR